jgi:hypothetical protein
MHLEQQQQGTCGMAMPPAQQAKVSGRLTAAAAAAAACYCWHPITLNESTATYVVLTPGSLQI